MISGSHEALAKIHAEAHGQIASTEERRSERRLHALHFPHRSLMFQMVEEEDRDRTLSIGTPEFALTKA